MGTSTKVLELRCGCHRLLGVASSTSSGRIEIQCPRCKVRAWYQWAEGVA